MSVQVTIWPRGLARSRASGPLGVDYGGMSRRVGAPVFISDIGQLTEVAASTRYEDTFGGHDLASWTIKTLAGYAGGMFRPGDHVRITKGGGTVFEGEYSEAEPSDEPGVVTMHAKGYGYNLYDYDSIYWKPVAGGDDIYYPTNKLGPWNNTITPFDGWAYAVQELGMPITQVVGGTPAGWNDSFGQTAIAAAPVKLADVVSANAREVGKRWAVWGRSLVVAADPTTPLWAYSPPASVFGVATDEYATHVGVWYVKEGPAPWSNVTAYVPGDRVFYGNTFWSAIANSTAVVPVEGPKWREDPVAYRNSEFSMVWAIDYEGLYRFDARTAGADYRGLGKMDPTRAGDLAQMLLTQVKGSWSLSGGFTIGPESGFTSNAGGRADIAFVRAGQAMRLVDVRTGQGNLMPGNGVHVIGKTEWSWSSDGSESTTITPMGSVRRSLSDVLQGSPLDAAAVVAGGKPTK